MTEKKQIRAVIFDMGGVIIRTEDRRPRNQLAAQHGLSYDDLSRLVFDSELAAAATLGRVSDQQLWGEVAAQLNIPVEESDSFAAAFWSGDRLDRDLYEYIRSLRVKLRTALLSNAWPDARKSLTDRFACLDVFDVVIFSAEVGLAKPAPAIYRLVLNRLGLQPEEAIFVDDFPENVQAASQLGIYAIRFESTQQIMQKISELLG